MVKAHPLLGRLPDDEGWPPVRTSGGNSAVGAFGWTRKEPDGRPKAHKGVDELCVVGAPCHAAHDGTVSRSAVSASYGEVVYLSGADGLETRYAHLSERLCSEGDTVTAGALLGRTGKTGNAAAAGIPPHLHWEVRYHDIPVDPLKWLHGLFDPLAETP